MRLNDWFTQSYRTQREEIEQRLRVGEPQLFIRLGDELVLHALGHRSRALVRDAAFHRLKTEAHVPVALHLLFAPLTQCDQWPGAALSTLQQELDEQSARADARGPLRASKRWLDDVLLEGRVEEGDLRRLEECTREGVLHHIDRAAESEMVALDTAVRAWTESWSNSDWERTLVVICAGSQPRYRQASLQYFERLLHVTPDMKSGARRSSVLYAENCRSEEEAIQHVASYLLDRRLGRVFMNSPLAMQQDLLADAAERAIDALGLPRFGRGSDGAGRR